ncbi:hypothetical protein VP01_1098g2 [Puccinia sorghi]|uniref:Uncharacterized protein n=1 Tax=Puccinia sorghi TaxID=27349 RepID=A0A0L6VSY6_9BASI|nr:hypothetical protein VP01_1098g2 [Puccinia sorghi]
MHSHFAYCTVTVPKHLHIQTGSLISAWLENAAFKLKSVAQFFFQFQSSITNQSHQFFSLPPSYNQYYCIDFFFPFQLYFYLGFLIFPFFFRLDDQKSGNSYLRHRKSGMTGHTQRPVRIYLCLNEKKITSLLIKPFKDLQFGFNDKNVVGPFILEEAEIMSPIFLSYFIHHVHTQICLYTTSHVIYFYFHIFYTSGEAHGGGSSLNLAHVVTLNCRSGGDRMAGKQLCCKKHVLSDILVENMRTCMVTRQPAQHEIIHSHHLVFPTCNNPSVSCLTSKNSSQFCRGNIITSYYISFSYYCKNIIRVIYKYNLLITLNTLKVSLLPGLSAMMNPRLMSLHYHTLKSFSRFCLHSQLNLIQ